MGKWGVFSALRYLGADSAADRRTVRADGRPLQRPLGNRSERVRIEARRRRQARRQPWWPRVAGWMLMSMALLAAVEGDYPMPGAAQAGISVAAAGCLVAIDSTFPGGPQDGVPVRFEWQTDAPPPYSVVLLDAGYREIARVDGLPECSMRPDFELAQRLGDGGTFHWYVQAECPDGTFRSVIEAFEIL